MPNLNRTGPQGAGPRTGRGMGKCAPGNNLRFGFGRGYGVGRGRRFFNAPQATEQEEKQALQDELKALREEAKQIESRLEELKK